MDLRGRRHGPIPGDHQHPPSTSYTSQNPSGVPVYPAQYASNYAPAYPSGEILQQRMAPIGGTPRATQAAPSGAPPRPVISKESYGRGISPPLPTSAPAYHSYASMSYEGNQYARPVSEAPHRFSPQIQAQPANASQGQSPFSMMNPWSMLSSVSSMGQNVQASQEYVSSTVSWFTGGFFLQLFQVDSNYVFKKLVMLILPYLHKYDYVRSVDRVDGNATIMAAPHSDLYAPDLYIPLLAMFTYVILAASNKFAYGLFTPDVVHSMVTWAAVAWGLNFSVLWTVVRLMALQNPPPGVEVFAYSGYVFINFCISILCGWFLGRGAGWHIAWLYTSLCMSVFLIRTYKYYIRSNIPQAGPPAGRQFDLDNPSNNRRNAHLMLVMGAAQFVLSWLMGMNLNA